MTYTINAFNKNVQYNNDMKNGAGLHCSVSYDFVWMPWSNAKIDNQASMRKKITLLTYYMDANNKCIISNSAIMKPK